MLVWRTDDTMVLYRPEKVSSSSPIFFKLQIKTTAMVTMIVKDRHPSFLLAAFDRFESASTSSHLPNYYSRPPGNTIHIFNQLNLTSNTFLCCCCYQLIILIAAPVAVDRSGTKRLLRKNRHRDVFSNDFPCFFIGGLIARILNPRHTDAPVLLLLLLLFVRCPTPP